MPATIRSLTNGRGSDRDLVYLLMLARKYGLEPAALHDALAKAKNSKAATCGSLSIELRERGDNTFCFMFSQKDRSVAQAAVSDTSLARLRSVPLEFKRLLSNHDPDSKVTGKAELERRISDLHIGLRHVTLKAKVTEKSEVRAVESRNGSPLVVCVATLSDGTGHVRLPLWNRQVNSVKKNDTVVIRDATVKNFRGEMQLSLPWKTGSISTLGSASGSH
jgi:replication factor A1